MELEAAIAYCDPRAELSWSDMPPVPIILQPGINTQPTPALNATGFSESGNIRFFQGLPQKMGGFRLFCNAIQDPVDPTLGSSAVALRAWAALSGIKNLAIAGENRLSLFAAETVSDITPVTINTRIPISLSTMAGDSLVTVEDPLDTVVLDQIVRFRGPISVGGIVIDGPYSVITITDATHYIIHAAQNAISTVANGGVARRLTTVNGSRTVAVFFPNHGLYSGEVTRFTDPITGGGLTIEGNYIATVSDPDNFTFDAGSIATSAATFSENNGNVQLTLYNPASGGAQNPLEVESFSLDNWGEFLVAIPLQGPVCIWKPAMGPTVPAAAVPTAPLANTCGFVASQQQILVVCGTINFATALFDPLLVRWSDVGDYEDFLPLSTNQAGSFRLQLGSGIIGALSTASRSLIWTDLALYSMQYIQPPLVFGFQPIGENCGLIGQHAMAAIGDTVVWMSREQFYVSAGGSAPKQLPCTVWDQVFANLDPANVRHTVCVTNAYFNEAIWFVPQIDGTICKAKVQLDNGQWDYTILAFGDVGNRTAAIDQNVFGPPFGASPDGSVYQEETGKDANELPLDTRILTGIAMIAEGDQFAFFTQIRPDVKFANVPGTGIGTVLMTVYVYNNPQESPRVKGPYPINARTRTIPCRGRGRGLQFEFRSTDLDSFWRLGRIIYSASADGKGG